MEFVGTSVNPVDCPSSHVSGSQKWGAAEQAQYVIRVTLVYMHAKLGRTTENEAPY